MSDLCRDPSDTSDNNYPTLILIQKIAHDKFMSLKIAEVPIHVIRSLSLRKIKN